MASETPRGDVAPPPLVGSPDDPTNRPAAGSERSGSASEAQPAPFRGPPPAASPPAADALPQPPGFPPASAGFAPVEVPRHISSAPPPAVPSPAMPPPAASPAVPPQVNAGVGAAPEAPAAKANRRGRFNQTLVMADFSQEVAAADARAAAAQPHAEPPRAPQTPPASAPNALVPPEAADRLSKPVFVGPGAVVTPVPPEASGLTSSKDPNATAAVRELPAELRQFMVEQQPAGGPQQPWANSPAPVHPPTTHSAGSDGNAPQGAPSAMNLPPLVPTANANWNVQRSQDAQRPSQAPATTRAPQPASGYVPAPAQPPAQAAPFTPNPQYAAPQYAAPQYSNPHPADVSPGLPALDPSFQRNLAQLPGGRPPTLSRAPESVSPSLETEESTIAIKWAVLLAVVAFFLGMVLGITVYSML